MEDPKQFSEIDEADSTSISQFYNNLTSFSKSGQAITIPPNGKLQYSELIKNIQIGLAFLGYSLPKYGADGYFGDETATALLHFNKDSADVAAPSSHIQQILPDIQTNSQPTYKLPQVPANTQTPNQLAQTSIGGPTFHSVTESVLSFSDFIKLNEASQSIIIDQAFINSLVSVLQKKNFTEEDLAKHTKPTSTIGAKEPNKFTASSSFYDALGQRESSNNYKAVNSAGYLGKYQFGLPTLQWLGFNTTKDQFLNDPDMQEQAVRAYVKKNQQILKPYIDKYAGKPFKTINGKELTITEPGMLAGAHLGGAGAVQKFFKTGGVHNPKDSNATSVLAYMEEFTPTSLV